MQKETKIKPNTQIYTTVEYYLISRSRLNRHVYSLFKVLNASSHSGLLDQAKEIFLRHNIDLPDLWKYVIMARQTDK